MTQSRYTVEQIAALLKRPGGRVRNVAPRSDRTYKGVVYDSKVEMMYAFNLDKEKGLGIIWDWKRQVKFPIIWPGGPLICNFVVDFAIQDEVDKPWRYIELKGWQSPEWRLKRKLIAAAYPDLSYQVVKL